MLLHQSLNMGMVLGSVPSQRAGKLKTQSIHALDLIPVCLRGAQSAQGSAHWDRTGGIGHWNSPIPSTHSPLDEGIGKKSERL